MPRYSIKKILEMKNDVMLKMNKKELYSLVSQASSYANKRRSRAIKSLESRTDIPLPQAYRNNFDISKGTTWAHADFDVDRNMSVNELRGQLSIIKKFLNTKTSTVEGWENSLRDFIDRVSAKTNVLITSKNYSKFWDIYNRLTSIYLPESNTTLDSEQIQKMLANIYEEYPNLDEDSLLNIMSESLDKEYIKMQESDEEFDNFDVYFRRGPKTE